MNILLLGATGQLGSELLPRLQQIGSVTAPSRQEVGISPIKLLHHLDEHRIDLIVNTISYKDVHGAEQSENALEVHKTNVLFPDHLSALADRFGLSVVHYSTDFVFDGLLPRPYVEDDYPAPLNRYGASKHRGDCAIRSRGLVIRTAGLYRLGHPNFVTTILNKAVRDEEIRVVEDQIGSPTWAADLADATQKLLEAGGHKTPGFLHLSGSGAVSRYEFARAIVRLAHSGSRVVPIKTSELEETVARPCRVVLDCSKAERLFGITMPPWQESLERAFREPRPTR